MYFDNNSSTATMGTAVSVPSILGFGYSFFNAFGHNLTEMYETAMSPVGNYSIAQGGYGSSIRNSINLMNHNPSEISSKYGANIQSFVADCVIIPFSSKGSEGQDKISELLS